MKYPKKKSGNKKPGATLRKVRTGLGYLLYPIGVGGALLIHFLAAYIAYLKYGTLGAIVVFALPILSTVWAMWVTISNGTWGYTGLVVAYVILVVTVNLLFYRKEED